MPTSAVPQPHATGPTTEPPRLRQAPEQREMALVCGLAFFLNLFPGSLLQVLHTRWGLVITQLLFIAGPAILAARWFYIDRRAIVPLRRLSAGAILATLMGTVALNYLLTVAGE